MKLKHRMVEKETVETKQSLLVLPVAHSATNGDNGNGFSNSNELLERTSNISNLHYKKLNFSSQKRRRGVNSFDNHN